MQIVDINNTPYKIAVNKIISVDEDIKFAWMFLPVIRIRDNSDDYGFIVVTNKHIFVAVDKKIYIFIPAELMVYWSGVKPSVGLQTFFPKALTDLRDNNGNLEYSLILEDISKKWSLDILLIDGDYSEYFILEKSKIQKLLVTFGQGVSYYIMPSYKVWAIGQFLRLLHLDKKIYMEDIIKFINGFWDEHLSKVTFIIFPSVIVFSLFIMFLFDKLNILQYSQLLNGLIALISLVSIAYIFYQIYLRFKELSILMHRLNSRDDTSLFTYN